ncbi:MAG TPA: ATP-binding protein [Actinomycetota bacterium]|nr:ATP-binding protein [Actinomycetota bacterium]
MTGGTRWVALAAFVLTMLLVVATAVLFTVDGAIGSDPVSNLLALFAIACYGVVGALIAWRLPRSACGWLLLLIGLGLVVTTAADAATTIALREGRTGFASWALWLNSWLLVATVWPGIVVYLLVFPTGALPSRRWRSFVIAIGVLAAVGAGAHMVATWTDEPVLANPLAIAALASVADAAFILVSFAFAVALIAAVVSVVLRFRRASQLDRQALRWLAVVAVLAGALLVVAIGAGVLGLHRIGDPAGALFLLSVILGLPLSAAVALLKRRLSGIEVVANRAIVYAAVVAAITVIYAVVVGGVGAAVGGGDRPDVLAAVAATVLAALAFQPVRRRAQVLADRVVYGERASPYELVATFTERLDDATLQELLPRMATLVAEGTGADRVRVWLRAGDVLRAVAGFPPDLPPAPSGRLQGGELPILDDKAFAVRHGRDLLGAITVGMPPQEPMTPTTERLLLDLTNQAALVLRNVALLEELQRSRQRLVTSQDEARRQLERDLHDGAQQRLVTLSMDLRMAREQALASGDAELTSRLDAAEQELARSLAELRELARGIHPAILTQNGLGAALRSLAERSTVLVELRSAPEARYSPEVEATAYFVVSEALANVAKHARASRAWVEVRDGDGRLSIEVTDDGVGGADVHAGSGLMGLTDRVEAVGGRIGVRSDPGTGTSVFAEIPCASR